LIGNHRPMTAIEDSHVKGSHACDNCGTCVRAACSILTTECVARNFRNFPGVAVGNAAFNRACCNNAEQIRSRCSRAEVFRKHCWDLQGPADARLLQKAGTHLALRHLVGDRNNNDFGYAISEQKKMPAGKRGLPWEGRSVVETKGIFSHASCRSDAKLFSRLGKTGRARSW